MIKGNKFYYSKETLFMALAASMNFELNEVEILEQALEVGFVTEVGENKYEENDNY